MIHGYTAKYFNLLLILSFLLLGTSPVFAGSNEDRIKKLENQLNQVRQELKQIKNVSENNRLDEIERNLSVLAEELKKVKAETAGGSIDIELKEVFGGAPGASKVYLKPGKGPSVGGYGELVVSKVPDDGDNVVDAQRVILYAGYKFNDNIFFNSEIEFEHGSTGGNPASPEVSDGSASVEFAYLDFLIKDYFNLRGGLLLVPFGLINEIHEPTGFYGVFRPSVERRIIPTTWRENGLGLHGEFDLQSVGNLSYKAFVMNSTDSEGFRAKDNRNLRTRGDRSLFNDVAFVGRLEYDPYPGITVGGSVYFGNTGQDKKVDNEGSAFHGEKIDGMFTMYEVDANFKYRGFHLRTLAAWTSLDDAELINANNGYEEEDSVGDEQFGYYVTVAYNVLTELETGSRYLKDITPFFRFENYDTQKSVPAGFSKNPANDRTEYTFGMNYKPIPNVVIKADYQWLENEANSDNNQFNFGMGYVF